MPVAYYPLDEVNGSSFVDLMAQARGTGYNLGSFTGVTLASGLGPISRSKEQTPAFTTNATAAGTASAGTGSQSWECWFYPTTLSSFGLAMTTLSTSYFGFRLTGGNYRLVSSMRINAANVLSGGNTNVAVNTWMHAGMIWNGTTHKVYYNGVEDGTASPATGLVGTADKTQIGYGGGNSLVGRIAHAAFYNYAIDSSRLRAHYLAGINGVRSLAA